MKVCLQHEGEDIIINCADGREIVMGKNFSHPNAPNALLRMQEAHALIEGIASVCCTLIPEDE